ncbi:MAG: hypothetical protein HZA54_07560 [Planctomycetes bacterium]|nr:hypothetical protein [Planctomycetota bacterium]
MKHYRCVLAVNLHSPLTVEDEEDGPLRVIGYFRVYALKAASASAAQAVVMAEIRDGDIDWADSSLEEVELGELPPEIRVHGSASPQAGIWYQSGRTFFP